MSPTVPYATEKRPKSKPTLQMTEILDMPFDKIAINLVMECETSTSGKKHILTIIDHLPGWLNHSPYWINQLIQ